MIEEGRALFRRVAHRKPHPPTNFGLRRQCVRSRRSSNKSRLAQSSVAASGRTAATHTERRQWGMAGHRAVTRRYHRCRRPTPLPRRGDQRAATTRAVAFVPSRASRDSAHARRRTALDDGRSRRSLPPHHGALPHNRNARPRTRRGGACPQAQAVQRAARAAPAAVRRHGRSASCGRVPMGRVRAAARCPSVSMRCGGALSASRYPRLFGPVWIRSAEERSRPPEGDGLVASGPYTVCVRGGGTASSRCSAGSIGGPWGFSGLAAECRTQVSLRHGAGKRTTTRSPPRSVGRTGGWRWV